MTKQNLYIDLNVIQTVPSSNINRDDIGAPKTALYGGVTRARVSSQSWKRAIRQSFKKDNIGLGFRTKKIAELLAIEIQNTDPSLEEELALKRAISVLSAIGINFDGSKSKELLFVTQGQVSRLARYAIDNGDELAKSKVKIKVKNLIEEQFQYDHTLDLALFGRMIAADPKLNVEASSQVAHAISTHEVIPEFDYFTALDDLQTDDSTGAAMLGVVNFNSATLYRYANLNVCALAEKLVKEDLLNGVEAFVRDFILSMPTGKQNTFANKTLPSYVMITIRRDTPVNLVSAFENPVVSSTGFVGPSIRKLEEEYLATQQFVNPPISNLVLSKTDSQVGDQVINLSELLEQVTAALSKVVQDENINS
ncbi:type I-E CRISPR-associated protein Cas7/Cse4/CasC [Lactiplantibacillus dongliensis]|uniref:Type I-E CRISPR-associated protein Cas7/Cse4/CasC n=1 Tax=Lactiplantibacillus dongliensis TaxID=2559919 RepID=A0ABW1R7R1_9LACO|nr:type I-E CRISPR-associated protein Cas7/Cse4/CasC [Lactiplantibacillus dongliensis]